MAQTGFTPILLYSSSTAAAAPTAGNLTNSTLGSELAINIADGKLFYKDSGGSIQVIAWKTTPTTAGGTGLTSYTAGDLLYYATGTALSKLGIGASGNYLSSSGSAPQWSAPAALTKTDDTNVTLTLGGSASTALLNAASLTLGWTGQLATSRGGTGLASFTANQVFYASSTSAIAQSSNLTFNGTTLTVNDLTDSSLTINRIVYAGTGGNLVNSANLTFDGTNFATTGTASATKFIPTGGTATGNGMYLPAANTVAFSTNGAEAMRIISTGRVGVTAGQNPLGRFEVADGASLTTAGAWASATFAAKQVGGFINDLSQIVFGYHAGTQTYGSAYFGFLETNQGANGYGDLVFGTRAVNTDTQPTERARIVSSGEVLIGQTTSVGVKLQVGGYTGTYASSAGLGVNGNSEFQNNLQIGALAGTGSRTVTANANGLLAAASDASLKQEVTDIQVGGLAELMQVQPKAYKWLSDIEERGENAAVEFGFFANQVAPIIPPAAPKGRDGLYGFYDRSLLAVMTKAIQEQQAIIESLTNRISALETSKG